MATRKTSRGQSSPVDQPIPCAAAEATNPAVEPAPAHGITVSCGGVTVTLPPAFWLRLGLGLVGFAAAIAGIVLYDIATDPDVWSDD